MFRRQSTVLRQALYEQVWSEPMVLVARKYELSDRGLAKLCARYEIPVPGRGYWARRQHGYTDRRPPLPECPSQLDMVYFSASESEHLVTDSVPAFAPIESAQAVTIDLRARPTHSALRQIRAGLKGQRVDSIGLLHFTADGLRVTVSPASLSRALRVLDAMLRAVECQGGAAGWKGQPPPGKFELIVADEALGIVIDEKCGQVRDLDELAKHRRKHPYFDRPWFLRPRGALSVKVVAGGWERRVWQDGKRHTLESRLPEIVVSLWAVADELKKRREEAARAAASREVVDRLRASQRMRSELFERLALDCMKHDQLAGAVQKLEEAARSDAVDWRVSRWVRWARLWVERREPVATFLIRLKCDQETDD